MGVKYMRGKTSVITEDRHIRVNYTNQKYGNPVIILSVP